MLTCHILLLHVAELCNRRDILKLIFLLNKEFIAGTFEDFCSYFKAGSQLDFVIFLLLFISFLGCFHVINWHYIYITCHFHNPIEAPCNLFTCEIRQILVFCYPLNMMDIFFCKFLRLIPYIIKLGLTPYLNCQLVIVSTKQQ